MAEIERRIATYKNITGADRRTDALISLKNFLNTLEVIEVGVDFGDSEGDKSTFEVKEVDLDFQTFAKEMETVFSLPSSKTKNTEEEPLNWEFAIAKHFFELGLKAQKGE